MPAHYLRREFLENEAAQSSDSTTYRLDMPETGMLSALALKLRATNGSTDNKNCMIKDIITQIQVIGNGSTVIFSLTGEELDREAWKYYKQRSSELASEEPDDVQFQTFILPFGRVIGDKKFGLNLDAWTNVQLQIQYNLAAVNAVGANGFVTGTFSVTVISYRYPQNAGVRAAAFQKTSEIDQPTDATSGTRRYELPLQNKLIEVGLLVVEDNAADDTDVTAIRLELDSGENILYDTNWDDLQQENTNMYNINGRQVKSIFRSDADTVDFETGICRGVQLTAEHIGEATADQEKLLLLESRSGSRITIGYFTLDLVASSEEVAADTSDDTQLAAVDGDGVGNMVWIPLAMESDWSDAMDSKAHGKIEVVITSGASGATLGLVLKELVTKQGA